MCALSALCTGWVCGWSAWAAQEAARIPFGMRSAASASGGMSTSSGPVKKASAGIPSSRNSSRWSSPMTSATSGRALASAPDSDSIASWQRRYLRSQTSGASSFSSAGSASARSSP